MADLSELLDIPGVREYLWERARSIAINKADRLASQGFYQCDINGSRRVELVDEKANALFDKYLRQLGVSNMPSQEELIKIYTTPDSEGRLPAALIDNKTGKIIDVF